MEYKLILRPESKIVIRGVLNPRVTVSNRAQVVRIIQSAAPAAVGGGSIPTESVPYIHNQTTEQLQWTVNHNLGFKPSISILSVGGIEVEAQVLHTSVNQVVISFQIPYKGVAIAR